VAGSRLRRLAVGERAGAKHLFAGMAHHLAVDAVLVGDEPGEVYANGGARPTAAVLFGSNDHRVYLAGAARDPDLDAEVAGLLLERRHGRAPFTFVVYHDGGRWSREVAAALPGAEVTSAQRRFLRLRPAGGARRWPTPDGLAVRRIDAALLAEGLRHTDELVEEICSESPSTADFLARKLGYCVLDRDAIVGFCCSEYDHAGQCELGVTTLAPYRRRGVATVAAAATIAAAFQGGARAIGWHCWADNTASVALAARLGFESVVDYPVLVCHWRG
jgi:hypothetical protein